MFKTKLILCVSIFIINASVFTSAPTQQSTDEMIKQAFYRQVEIVKQKCATEKERHANNPLTLQLLQELETSINNFDYSNDEHILRLGQLSLQVFDALRK